MGRQRTTTALSYNTVDDRGKVLTVGGSGYLEWEDIAFKAEDYGLPVLALSGDCTGMTKDDYVTLAYTFQGTSGSVDVKKQGSSSIGTGTEIGAGFDNDVGGLFNFTLNFPEAFEAKEGWGEQKKYCFKANAIDHSHARNVCSCKLWGEMVRSRSVPLGYNEHLYEFVDLYSYEDGVLTANFNNRSTGMVTLVGVTLAQGGQRITAEVYFPEGAAETEITSYIVDINTGNSKYVQVYTGKTGEWVPITIETLWTDGDSRVAISGCVNGVKFRNLKFENLYGGKEIIYYAPPKALFERLPNGGAIDGFPIIVTLNGKYYALGTFNIPKDGWMFGSPKAILSADTHCAATQFRTLATLEGDFDLEYVEDEANADWVLPSLNAAIQAVLDCDGSNFNATVAQRIDIASAIDYYIHTIDEMATDGTDKNYLLVTFDGLKWYFSAYDRDTVYGLEWTGKGFNAPDASLSFESYSQLHKLMGLIYNYKKPELKARAVELRDGIKSEAHVADIFTNFGAGIPAEVLAQNCRRWPLLRSTNASNTAQILNWYRLRRQLIDKEIDAM